LGLFDGLFKQNVEKLERDKDVEGLIKVLGNPNKDIRSNAVLALGKIGDIKAVEPLITALKDSDSDVRNKAAWSLGAIGDPRAIEPLIASLKDPLNIRSHVKMQLPEALSLIRSSVAIEMKEFGRCGRMGLRPFSPVRTSGPW
jgi:HEAT repeat protein